MTEILLPQALCTDADAKAAGSIGATGSKASTDEWIRKVNAASVRFLELCGREIVSGDATGTPGALTVPQTDRVFDVRELLHGWPHHYLHSFHRPRPVLEIGDAASIVTVSVEHADGSSSTLAGTDWITLPRRRRFPWEAIEELEFARTLAWARDDTITVRATWGFPIVPQDVREAVARAASSWIAQDVRRYGEVFSNEENTSPPDPGAAHVLPRHAYETAMSYRRARFG